MISQVGYVEKAAEVVRIASALPYFSAAVGVVKTAAETLDMSKKEERNISKTLKQLAPKTDTEEKVQQLAGRSFTPGQYARYGAIGSGMGAVGHIAGSAVAGGNKWLPWATGAEKAELAGLDAAARAAAGKALTKDIAKAVLHPRQLARAGIMGTVFGLGIPTFRRLADIHAAKKGKF